MVPANGQTTKTKKSFICCFGWKAFPSYYKYIHSCAIFVLEKGGVCFYWVKRASIGTYTVYEAAIMAAKLLYPFESICKGSKGDIIAK